MVDNADDRITVFWRPGCVFCTMLRGRLRARGVPFDEVNIWDDPEAAAFVRSVARGSETVPTVSIGKICLVNPSSGEVIDTARRVCPQLVLPAGDRSRRLLDGNLVTRLFGGRGSKVWS